MADWAGERAGLHFIPPGQPWRNGYIESFNSRVRDECLNINMFWSLAQARVVDQRLEGGLQPPPATLRARLPAASCLRDSPHPPMIDSH
jgi:transposase InsO family protein